MLVICLDWILLSFLVSAAGCAIFHQCLSDVKLGKLTNINIRGTAFHNWLNQGLHKCFAFVSKISWQGRCGLSCVTNSYRCQLCDTRYKLFQKVITIYLKTALFVIYLRTQSQFFSFFCRRIAFVRPVTDNSAL